MKKIIALVFSCLCLLSLAVPAFADRGYFIESPSVTPGPDLGEDVVDVDIIQYGKRDELDEEHRIAFEKAYASIADTSGESTDNLNDIIARIAEEENIPVDVLAVGDLFYLTDAAAATASAGYALMPLATETNSVTLISENLTYYVALIHYDGQAWSIVEDAELNKEGELEFEVADEDLGVFALVVRTDGVAASTGLGVGAIIAIIIGAILMAAAIAAFLYFFVYKKKHAVAI